MASWQRFHRVVGVGASPGMPSAEPKVGFIQVVGHALSRADGKWEASAFQDVPMPSGTPFVRPPTPPTFIDFPKIGGLGTLEDAQQRADSLIGGVYPGHACSDCGAWQQATE
jgi:hypothetical protein